MERVAQLLDPGFAGYSYRSALLRLWVLASNDQQLNHWEQEANETTVAPHRAHFLERLQNELPIQVEAIQAQPLALIRALDDYLASTRLPDTKTSVMTDEGKDFWLVPVQLEARRQAAMNRQPARLAKWFHHHAALPALTAHGIAVTVSEARSSLHTALQRLANQPGEKLKVWIAHFDDGADVVWDRQTSPIKNWRTQSVEPHDIRSESAIQTLSNAAKAGAQVVVFPEFSLDIQHREHVAAFLRQNTCSIQLVVAGAFHESEPTGNMVAYNTAPVFTGSGSKLFAHRKLRLFGTAEFGAEFCELGNGLHVLITPIGCMTVLICKDFMDDHHTVNNLLAEVPVDWVWVPSYGNETTSKLNKDRAKKLADVTVGTSCGVAQTQNTAMKRPDETQAQLPGFGHQAGEKTPRDVGVAGGLLEYGLAMQPKPQTSIPPALKRVK